MGSEMCIRDRSHDTEYSPEDDINTTVTMPCDIVKIVFWVIFYKVEYNLNFPNCTLFFIVLCAFGTLFFQYYACMHYLKYMTDAQTLSASEQPPWIVHWLGILNMFMQM